MPHHRSKRKKRARTAAALVMLAGLGVSALLYWRAQNDPRGGVSADYAMEESMRGSKRYVHDLEIYGGKANVLASDAARWFSGLWEGTQLAVTVAVLSAVISIAILVVDDIVNYTPPPPGSNGGAD